MKRKPFTTKQQIQRIRLAHVIGRIRFADGCIKEECYRTAQTVLKGTITWLRKIGKDI